MAATHVHFAVPLCEAQRVHVTRYLSAHHFAVRFVGATQLWRELEAVEFLIVGRPPRFDWARASRLRLIHVAGSGVDPLFPAVGLRSEVVITNSRGAHAELVTEHVLALLLALFRDLPRAFSQQNRKEWRSYSVESIAGKRLCVVGLGEVGTRVAKAASALGMHVIGVCRTFRDCVQVERVFDVSQIHAAVGDADVVALCLPLTSATRHLFDATLLGAMKSGSRLINVSRGAIVDEQALVSAVKRGHLTAALDVFEEEPLPPTSELWNCPGVIITPHIGGLATNYVDSVLALFVAAANAVARGEVPPGCVDRDREY